MTNIQRLEALSMDLYRIAIGYQRGSKQMAERFLGEALEQKGKIDTTQVKPYLKNIIDSISSDLITKNNGEYALMCGILIQNYCKKYFR